MESQVSGIFFIILHSFQIIHGRHTDNCKTYVGEMRNIIILKSHLPTLLFVQPVPWPSVHCVVGMKSSLQCILGHEAGQELGLSVCLLCI